MTFICGRVVAGTPADTSLSHRSTAVVSHIASSCSSGLGDVGKGGRVYSWEVGFGGELFLLTIGQALAILGIGTHIVFGSRGEAVDRNRERSFACTAISMAVAHGRTRLGAPADAAFGHCAAALVGHRAMALSRCGRNIGYLLGGYHWQAFQSHEAHFGTISNALGVLGVSPNIIGRIGSQPCHIHCIITGACAAVGVAVADGWIVVGAPANAAFSDTASTLVGHIAATLGTGGSDVGDGRSGHYGQTLCCGESQIVAVGSALGIGGITADVIGGAGGQPRQVNAENAQSGFTGCLMMSCDGRVGVFAPTHATLNEIAATVVTYIAHAEGSRCGNLVDFNRGDRRQCNDSTRFEVNHLAEPNAHGVLGVGTYIIMGG